MSSDLEKKIMENENQDGNQDPQSPEKTTLVETLLKICDEMRGTRKLITTEVCKLESKLSEKITQETQKVNDNIDEKLAPLLADVEELKFDNYKFGHAFSTSLAMPRDELAGFRSEATEFS
ncbi:hypothetical protein M8J77_000255 [Diaphorina citri]|nr:hypothetical protein M8J77_000255 [Diaphorina citri]